VNGKHPWKTPAMKRVPVELRVVRCCAVLLINLALGGSWAATLDDSLLPQNYLIDSVRVHQPDAASIRHPAGPSRRGSCPRGDAVFIADKRGGISITSCGSHAA
jgi:hypothetical protein